MRALLFFLFCPMLVLADASTCVGRFVNPITDICWSCVMPITLASVNIGATSKVKNRDTKNPKSLFCMCNKGPVPTPGITLGFWEPVRLIDVTRTPYCMVGLGGISLMKPDKTKMGSQRKESTVHSSFYHVHYYMYPVIYWLELITDLACLENGSFDLAYMSEFDPTYNDPKLQNLLHPESLLFGNILAQAACAIDTAAATISFPRDEIFWCAGSWGSMYPFIGYNGSHQGGVQTSNLLAARIIAKMHRIGLAHETSTDDASVNGKICRKSLAFKIKKSQYKLQMVYPMVSGGDVACFPIGLPAMMYQAFKEYPSSGEDFCYLLWRKKNCCLF